VASWPAHPLEPAERLALAEAFVAQAAGGPWVMVGGWITTDYKYNL